MPRKCFCDFIGSSLVLLMVSGWAAHGARALPKVKVDTTPISRNGGVVESYAPVVRTVATSVVSVYTRKKVTGQNLNLPQIFNDPFFRRFFGGGNGNGNGGGSEETPQREEQALGSGVIVSPDGYILTNNHVVDGADEIKVSTADGTEFTAKLVGTDPPTDVAVIKIDANNMPAATLADSSGIEVGDVVLAIGNPFGVGQTVTSGIVSAMERTGLGIEEYEDFIQTDASINPGNSGGALVDAKGRVIGLNTAIFSKSGGSMGIGFAVPINLVRSDMNQIITEGRVVRGFLGVSIQPLTPDLAKAFNAPNTKGALVAGVTPDSPAARAGFKEGDVIIEENGHPVPSARALRLMIAQTRPGTKTQLTVVRNGQKEALTATLAELPVKEGQLGSANPEEPAPKSILPGVDLQSLDESTRQQLKVPANLSGVAVANVDQGSSSYEAGLRAGDVITSINHKKVSNLEEARAAVARMRGNSALLQVWSDGGTRFAVIDLKKAG